jgi:hypothetical protein
MPPTTYYYAADKSSIISRGLRFEVHIDTSPYSTVAVSQQSNPTTPLFFRPSVTANMPDPSYSAETNSGTITSYISVPSGPAVPGCASATISYVAGYDPNNGTGPFNGAVYDLYWGKEVNTSMHCLPDAVTTSIWSSSQSGTVTYLGPFDCPALWTTAESTVFDKWGTIFYCCPS